MHTDSKIPNQHTKPVAFLYTNTCIEKDIGATVSFTLGPNHMPGLGPMNVWRMSQGGIKALSIINIPSPLFTTQKIYSRLFCGSNRNTMALRYGRTRQKNRVPEKTQEFHSRTKEAGSEKSYCIGFEDKRRGPWAKGCRQSLELGIVGKQRTKGLPASSPDLWASNFLQNFKIMHLCSFKLQSVVNCFNSNRK